MTTKKFLQIKKNYTFNLCYINHQAHEQVHSYFAFLPLFTNCSRNDLLAF